MPLPVQQPLVMHPRPLTLTLLVAAALLLPAMAAIGTFFDGLIYAAISRNLAAGVGSLWAPHFSEGLFPVFREHPPLVFWLQSLFFRALGDGYLTERVYDLVVLVVTVALLRVLWRRLVNQIGLPRLAGYWWLALLCLVVVPKWSWAYRSNVLENTMTLWCLAAVLLTFSALRASSVGKMAMLTALAGIVTLAAFLSKGLPALFVLPSAILLVPAAGGRRWRRAIAIAGAQTAVFAGLLALLLWAEPAARTHFAEWWQNQVAARAGLDGGWAMLLELAKKLAPMALVAGLCFLAVRRRIAAGWWQPVAGAVASMLAIGLSASVPLVLGDLDSGHYLLPSLPFYALAFGLLAAAALDSAGASVRERLARPLGPGFGGAVLVAAIAIVLLSAGRIGEVRKNEAYHELFTQVATVVGEGAVLGIHPSLYSDWTLHAVAQRYHRISLDAEREGQWMLLPSSVAPPADRTRLESGDWALVGPDRTAIQRDRNASANAPGSR